jgi:hypothetical protein
MPRFESIDLLLHKITRHFIFMLHFLFLLLPYYCLLLSLSVCLTGVLSVLYDQVDLLLLLTSQVPLDDIMSTGCVSVLSV